MKTTHVVVVVVVVVMWVYFCHLISSYLAFICVIVRSLSFRSVVVVLLESAVIIIIIELN